MCGIAGYSRPEGRSSIPSGREFAIQLAIALESRGRDATGMGWFQKGWPMFWKAGVRSGLIAQAADLPRHPRIDTCIVHTRAGSQGSPKIDANNHPVVAPGIILTHNGILTNDEAVYGLIGVRPDSGIVDSLAAAYLLSAGAEVELGEDPAELLELLEGDAALAWLNCDDDETLHLARLRGRPLVYTFTLRGDFIYGSTAEAIKAAAKAADVVVGESFTSVAEGTYLMVHRGEIVRRAPIKLPPEPRWRNYNGYVGVHPRRELAPVSNLHERFPSGKKRQKWSTKDQRWVDA